MANYRRNKKKSSNKQKRRKRKSKNMKFGTIELLTTNDYHYIDGSSILTLEGTQKFEKILIENDFNKLKNYVYEIEKYYYNSRKFAFGYFKSNSLPYTPEALKKNFLPLYNSAKFLDKINNTYKFTNNIFFDFY